MLQIIFYPLTAVVSSLSPLLRSVMSVSLIGIGALLQSLLLGPVTVLLIMFRVDFVVGESGESFSISLLIIFLFCHLTKCLSPTMITPVRFNPTANNPTIIHTLKTQQHTPVHIERLYFSPRIFSEKIIHNINDISTNMISYSYPRDEKVYPTRKRIPISE